MVIYWKRQVKFDILLAAVFACILIIGPHVGLPILVSVEDSNIVAAARIWVAPALTLLGMLCATTAFVFAVVDKPEFRFIRGVGVEKQLWTAFGECIGWLGIAALFSAGLSFIEPDDLNIGMRVVGTFFLIGVAICILKFCWLMCQIISVKVSQSK